MSIPPNVVLGGFAVLVIFVMAAALGVAWLAGRRHAEAGLVAPDTGNRLRTTGPDAAAALPLPGSDGTWAPDVVTIDRVIRVVALLFIAVVGVVVALSPLAWSGREVGIYVLLATGTLFIVFMQDLLPDRLTTRDRYVAEAVGAVTFLTLLVGLTEGLQSPFFVGYFLLVGGAALAAEGLGPVVLAVACAASYAVVGLLIGLDKEGPTSLDLGAFAWLGLNVVALALLAYVVSVAGRAQRRARDAALRLSRYDALTGLYNRGAFFAAVEREIKRAERSGRGFCVLMLDLDDLKPVNDTYGHPAGDTLLRAITEVVLHTVRATDLAGRYGGDEFVVLLPETDAEGAFVVAEKLRRDISTLAVRVQDRSVRTSVSLGLVAYPEDGRTIDELLSAVDAAMYEAKRRGKNQIVGYTTRTERVATAIGPERPGMGPARSRQARPDASRSAEIGLSLRPSVREESDEPIDLPPYGRAGDGPVGGAAAGRGAGGSAIASSGAVPGAVSSSAFVPAPPAIADEDPLDAAAPAYPANPIDDADASGASSAALVSPVAATPSATSAAASALAGTPFVPRAPAAPVVPVAPPASGAPAAPPAAPPAPLRATPASGSAPVVAPVSAEPRASFPRLPSMPSLPPQPIRADAAETTFTPAPGSPPVQPRDAAAAGRPPVPPAGGAPWQTRSSVPTSGSLAPRDPRKPADRQYVAFPIEGDDPDR